MAQQSKKITDQFSLLTWQKFSIKYQIQEHIKMTIYHDDDDFIPKMQGGSICMQINKCNPPHKQTKHKIHIIISLDTEKTLGKIPS